MMRILVIHVLGDHIYIRENGEEMRRIDRTELLKVIEAI